MIYDFIVIGGGISGASAAEALSAHGRVVLLEAESTPGYHSTGRSAALFTPHYGGAAVRSVTAISRSFFETPPEDFTDKPLLSPRGALTIAGPGLEGALADCLALSTVADPVRPISVAEAHELAPYMKSGRIAAAAFEPGVTDIDVAALHQGFLRSLRKQGGEIRLSFRVESLARSDGVWTARSGQQAVSAPVLVNAAGAWADQIGRLSGALPIGLVPKRRTAILVDMPDNIDASRGPAADFAGKTAYIKPETGRLMVSPGDETPVEPQDIQTDDFEIAVLVDWLEQETTLQIRRIGHNWAGLRSFVADGAPVVGFDAEAPGFFWLAGQGGYGIMMAPALAHLSQALITESGCPPEFALAGLKIDDLAPSRLRRS